jgi:C4-type Zn-finger protein
METKKNDHTILIQCPICMNILSIDFTQKELDTISLENRALETACDNCDYLITYDISFIATNER